VKVRAGAVCALLLAVTVPDRADAGDRTLRVASKAFTESVILGEIVTQAERAAGV